MKAIYFVLFFFCSINVHALDRVALIIGNANYEIAPLNNSINDAQAIKEALERLNFEVTLIKNANKRTMLREIESFVSSFNEDTTSLFFYAGHAVQLFSMNYLLPINSLNAIEESFDTLLDTEKIKLFENEAINLDSLTALIEDGNSKRNLVFLDACRTNPINVSRDGLSEALTTSKETLIAYSTSPGKKASDGVENSPYTKAFLKSINNSNQTIEVMLKEVANQVSSDSNQKQVPWYTSNLTSSFCFNEIGGQCVETTFIPDIPYLEGLNHIAIKVSDDGSKYIGQMENGIFQGKGVLYYADSSVHEGYFENNKKHGEGKHTDPNGKIFTGHFIEGNRHGSGIINWPNGATIKTEWQNGVRTYNEKNTYKGDRKFTLKGIVWEGNGLLEFASGAFYDGQFKDGKYNGWGKYVFPDGKVHIGNFIDGLFTGSGMLKYPNGDEVSGNFKNGFASGRGTMYFSSNDAIYTGEILTNRAHGFGTYENTNGSYYKGTFLNGKRHGEGVFTGPDGNRFKFSYEFGNIINTTPIFD